MKVRFIERKFNPKETSIEKLFNLLKYHFEKNKLNFIEDENPFSFSLMNVFKGIFYFKKKQVKDEINHITGDIHWAAILLAPKRTIITVHDLVGLRNYRNLKKIIYWLFWIYLPFKRAKYITVISNKTKNEIIQSLPSVANKIRVISNCVTVPIIEENYFKVNPVCEILIVGTRENKNVERCVMALKGLNLKVNIIGKLEQSHINLLDDNEIAYKNYVNIHEAELISIYKSSDFLLFPSLYEGFGLPVLEAQAQNVIVITSDASPMKEIGGFSVVLVNPNDISSIRYGIEVAISLNNEQKLAKIIEGKKNVQKYSPHVIAQEYMDLYRTIDASV